MISVVFFVFWTLFDGIIPKNSLGKDANILKKTLVSTLVLNSREMILLYNLFIELWCFNPPHFKILDVLKMF